MSRVEFCGPAVRRLLAGNPSPMTLEGTNTYLVESASLGGTVVIDPGPDLPEHVASIRAAAPRVVLIVLTHHHHDHADAAPALSAATGAPVRALDRALCRDAPALADGERLGELEVLTLAGHTADSLGLVLDGAQPGMFTGDTVLGRGTSVIAHPDGSLAAYLRTLDRLARVVATRKIVRLWPGHGPQVADPAEVLAYYRRHRLERLADVRAAVEAGHEEPAAIVRAVYGELDEPLRAAAARSVAAQLVYLSDAETARTPAGLSEPGDGPGRDR